METLAGCCFFVKVELRLADTHTHARTHTHSQMFKTMDTASETDGRLKAEKEKVTDKAGSYFYAYEPECAALKIPFQLFSLPTIFTFFKPDKISI